MQVAWLPSSLLFRPHINWTNTFNQRYRSLRKRTQTASEKTNLSNLTTGDLKNRFSSKNQIYIHYFTKTKSRSQVRIKKPEVATLVLTSSCTSRAAIYSPNLQSSQIYTRKGILRENINFKKVCTISIDVNLSEVTRLSKHD